MARNVETAASAVGGTPRELTITRTFDAPRELVWKAWTDERHLAQWWGSAGFTNPVCELDLRPGGAIRIHMFHPDYPDHWVKGTVLEAVKPERFVFSNNAHIGEHNPPSIESTTSVSLAERNGKTTLTLHVVVTRVAPDMAAALAGMETGWNQSLDRLAAAVAASGSADRVILTARTVNAPRDLVWKAWTEPERVAQWWGPQGFTTAIHEMNVAPGGVWRLTMRAPNGMEFPNTIVYSEVAKPARLAYRHSSGVKDDPAEFDVVVTFDEEGKKTKITMRHIFRSAAQRAANIEKYHSVAGAQETFERMAGHIAAMDNAAAGAAFTLQLPSEREIVVTRMFDAPRELVWEACTNPQHYAQWWGPRGFANTIHEMDMRPGGAWRITQRAPDGTTHPFKGVYREVVPPQRLVQTLTYDVEPFSKTEMLATMTLAEERGRTKFTMHSLFPDTAARDAMLANGMEYGTAEAYERLDELLAQRVAAIKGAA